MREETHNLTGEPEVCRVFDLTPVSQGLYWQAVTDIECPVCHHGVVIWYEAGYVPGYRICNGCGQHFMAKGNADAPLLVEIPGRVEDVESLSIESETSHS
jgi:uncharacterized protein (DUF983 family)